VPSMSSIRSGSDVFSNFLKPIDLGSTKVDRLNEVLLGFYDIVFVGDVPYTSCHWNVL
jgi:hypothetical protein